MIVLHYLDVMIGFAFTMLVISLAVTAMVQALPVYMRNLKGEALERGLTDLMVRVLPGLESHARVIVDHILRDPLLSPPRSGVTSWIMRDTAGRQGAAAFAQRGGAARGVRAAAAGFHGAG
jgi:hypothetical protein